MSDTKDKVFTRQCQECGNIQKAKKPESEPSESFRNAKCRRCKSPGALDYGRDRTQAQIDARPTFKDWIS